MRSKCWLNESYQNYVQILYSIQSEIFYQTKRSTKTSEKWISHKKIIFKYFAQRLMFEKITFVNVAWLNTNKLHAFVKLFLTDQWDIVRGRWKDWFHRNLQWQALLCRMLPWRPSQEIHTWRFCCCTYL